LKAVFSYIQEIMKDGLIYTKPLKTAWCIFLPMKIFR
jgi:hypothetical protein